MYKTKTTVLRTFFCNTQKINVCVIMKLMSLLPLMVGVTLVNAPSLVEQISRALCMLSQ